MSVSGGFDPEAFFRSLKKDLPSDPNYLNMTFEEFLKKKGVWDSLKDHIENKDDRNINTWRDSYKSEMEFRHKEKGSSFLNNVHKLFEKKETTDSTTTTDIDGEARRLAHVSEFGH